MDKNKWIEDVLNSTEGMEDAIPSDKLFSNISRKIAEGKTKVIPLRTVVSVAASILLLIAINVTMLLSTDNKQGSVAAQQSSQETIAEYYGLTETNLY